MPTSIRMRLLSGIESPPTPCLILMSMRASASVLTSHGPSMETCIPGSSQSGSNVGTMESVLVERMSTPRTASRGDATGSTSIPWVSLISLAKASRWAAVGL